MDGEAIPDLCGHFRAEDILQRLPAMDVELSDTMWIVFASGYAIAKVTATGRTRNPSDPVWG